MNLLNFASSALLTLSGIKIALCPMMGYDGSFSLAAICLGLIGMASATIRVFKIDMTD